MTDESKKIFIYSVVWMLIAILLMIVLIVYTLWQRHYAYFSLIIFVTILSFIRFLGVYLGKWKKKEEKSTIR